MGLTLRPEHGSFDPAPAEANEPPFISVLQHGMKVNTLGRRSVEDLKFACPYMRWNYEGQCYPCRKCIACLDQKRTLFAGLALAEAYRATNVIFVTLTYQDDCLDQDALDKSRIRAFVQRLRRAGYRFSYFGIGEYGGVTGRPHFHLILMFHSEGRQFDLPLEVTLRPEDGTCWPYGGAKFEPPKKEAGHAVMYLLDYVRKPHVRIFKSRSFGKEYLLVWAKLRAEIGAPLVSQKDAAFIQFSVPISREYRKRKDKAGATSARVTASERARKSLGGVNFAPLWRYGLPVSHLWAPELAEVYVAAFEAKWGRLPPPEYTRKIGGDF